MATTVGKDTDVHVTFEDQQMINQFARTNARMQDTKEELETKKKDIQNLEDACEELMLADEEDLIPYQIGEVFVHSSVEEATERLEENKVVLQDEMKNLDVQLAEYKKILSDLKVKLYAKFGSNINLDDED